ncbi:oligopeptide/dipeptide ABC transporter ATP-binding protein, partial [Natrarchaeobius sp. A-rgal3]|uniref:oligopeptide/dipeptide ABC transporter ATP-binding protein n=1 Tax=Natrarchaeobius versutus TaxID=1679078 RepID=UPI0035104600
KHPYTKVLRWATPDLRAGVDSGEPPVRKIDIPDPKNPPSGCRFHTRCPEARDACRREDPEAYDVGSDHEVSCFRELDEHGYWTSSPLADVESAGDTSL